MGIPDGEKFDDDCSCFDTIPPCDARRDGQTDILRQHSPPHAYASRYKNRFAICSEIAPTVSSIFRFGAISYIWR